MTMSYLETEAEDELRKVGLRNYEVGLRNYSEAAVLARSCWPWWSSWWPARLAGVVGAA